MEVSYVYDVRGRTAAKDDPKCQDCGRRYCTYNAQQCLKCHNKTPNICGTCGKRGFTYNDDQCYKCRQIITTFNVV